MRGGSLQINRWYAAINYLLGFVMCAACTYYAVVYLEVYAVVVVALWAAFLSKPIVEASLFLYRMAKNAPLRPYQGRYYAFGGRHIRILEVGGALWIVDADLLRTIGREATQAARRQALTSQHRYLAQEKVWVYSQPVALSILQNSGHAEAHRFSKWLENEVYAPHAKKHGRYPLTP